jgi:hypothetical protein
MPRAVPLAGCKLWCQDVERYLFFQNFILGRSLVSSVYSCPCPLIILAFVTGCRLRLYDAERIHIVAKTMLFCLGVVWVPNTCLQSEHSAWGKL